MRWKVSRGTVFAAMWGESDQIRKLACRQPWKPAPVIHPPQGKTPVTVEAVPPDLGDLEPFAAHGLHGIPEDGLYVSDEHARLTPRQRTSFQLGRPSEREGGVCCKPELVGAARCQELGQRAFRFL
jgi:hypothetical protein